jgi:hypothetical protein
VYKNKYIGEDAKSFLVLGFKKCIRAKSIFPHWWLEKGTFHTEEVCKHKFFCGRQLITAGDAPKNDCGFYHYTQAPVTLPGQTCTYTVTIEPKFFPIGNIPSEAFSITYQYKTRRNRLLTKIFKKLAILNPRILILTGRGV